MEPRSGSIVPYGKYTVRRLPKAELHLHLEGSIQPELALRLAGKHGLSLPGSEEGVEGLRRHYRFTSFDDFLRPYLALSRCLTDAEDFTTLTIDLAMAPARMPGVRRDDGSRLPGQCLTLLLLGFHMPRSRG